MRLTADRVISWSQVDSPVGVTLEKIYVGPDPVGLGGFQVALATASSPPSRQLLRDLFTARKGRTQIQLAVAVIHDGTAYLFGPDPLAQPVELPVEHAERQLQSVLSEPDVLAATERFAGFRKASASGGLAGFTLRSISGGASACPVCARCGNRSGNAPSHRSARREPTWRRSTNANKQRSSA